jgi:hypothetical protein
VIVHWLDRGYCVSDPEITRIEGPAIKVRHKSALTKDCVDVLCGRCGRVLYESKDAGKIVRMAMAARR